MPTPKPDRNGVFYYNGEDDIELADDDWSLVPDSWYYYLPLGDGHFAVLDPIGPYGSKREATADARRAARQMATGQIDA